MSDYIAWDQEQKIRELFIGKSVVKVNKVEGIVELSDGVKVLIEPNDGCGGCPNGYYEIDFLNEVPNIITDAVVTVTPFPEKDVWNGEGDRYTLFVFTDAQASGLVSVVGSEGNGYYGAGFHLEVTLPKS